MTVYEDFLHHLAITDSSLWRCHACSTYMLQGVRTAVQWCLYAAAGGGGRNAGAAWGGGGYATPPSALQTRPAQPRQPAFTHNVS